LEKAKKRGGTSEIPSGSTSELLATAEAEKKVGLDGT
jgi:hypothetical protein